VSPNKTPASRIRELEFENAQLMQRVRLLLSSPARRSLTGSPFSQLSEPATPETGGDPADELASPQADPVVELQMALHGTESTVASLKAENTRLQVVRARLFFLFLFYFIFFILFFLKN
jgi:hypothetical protein